MLTETKTEISPANGSKFNKIPFTDLSTLNTICEQASKAFKLWSGLTLKKRAEVFYNYRQLLNLHRDDLAELIHLENGKTIPEALAEVDKSIEVTEFACSLPQLHTGESLTVSRGINCQEQHYPIGVVAQIMPFNFPMMVPHWTLPISLCLGNTVIMKPSEKVPLTMTKCAELLKEAGLPNHCLTLVYGDKNAATALCKQKDIKAISFVGSTPVAQSIYKEASLNLKPALCMGGAKNHLIALPDADLKMTAKDIIASMSGCAGQRCMAASVLIIVGKNDKLIEQLLIEAKQLNCGENLGAIISLESKQRLENCIETAIKDGAECILDGRNPKSTEEKGYYLGPTILDNVTENMSAYKDELFGPILSIVRVNSIEEAINLENSSMYGNGASVYTQSGELADKIANELDSGMIGINIGVPVPREPFGFGGWNGSKFGVTDITGKGSLAFWTKTKKITKKWNALDKQDWMS